ncbi:MAG: hypothetical protein ABJL54_16085 [Halioglobus sp.]
MVKKSSMWLLYGLLTYGLSGYAAEPPPYAIKGIHVDMTQEEFSSFIENKFRAKCGKQNTSQFQIACVHVSCDPNLQIFCEAPTFTVAGQEVRDVTFLRRETSRGNQPDQIGIFFLDGASMNAVRDAMISKFGSPDFENIYQDKYSWQRNHYVLSVDLDANHIGLRVDRAAQNAPLDDI